MWQVAKMLIGEKGKKGGAQGIDGIGPWCAGRSASPGLECAISPLLLECNRYASPRSVDGLSCKGRRDALRRSHRAELPE